MLINLSSSRSLTLGLTCCSTNFTNNSSLLNGALQRPRFTPMGNLHSVRSHRTISNGIKHSTGSLEFAVEEQKKAWEQCKESITTINFSPVEADNMLGKAFGWAHSPYWGEERGKQVPKNESVIETLTYLRSLGLSGDDIYKLLKKFPEVLGCSLNDELKTNVAALEKEWGIKGKTLRSLLLRNPKVLGYNVDCKGDCIAKCTRCWVRF